MSNAIATGIATLATLKDQINEEHKACTEAAQKGIQHALNAGRLLLDAKAQCEHGTWGKWLGDNFDGSDRTARLYMQIADRWPEIESSKMATVANLGIRGVLESLAKPPPDREATIWLMPSEMWNLIAHPPSEADARFIQICDIAAEWLTFRLTVPITLAIAHHHGWTLDSIDSFDPGELIPLVLKFADRTVHSRVLSNHIFRRWLKQDFESRLSYSLDCLGDMPEISAAVDGRVEELQELTQT